MRALIDATASEPTVMPSSRIWLTSSPMRSFAYVFCEASRAILPSPMMRSSSVADAAAAPSAVTLAACGVRGVSSGIGTSGLRLQFLQGGVVRDNVLQHRFQLVVAIELRKQIV